MFVVLERDVEVVVDAEIGRDVAYYAVSQAMIALGEQVAVCSVAEAGVAELALEALAVSDVVVHRALVCYFEIEFLRSFIGHQVPFEVGDVGPAGQGYLR